MKIYDEAYLEHFADQYVTCELNKHGLTLVQYLNAPQRYQHLVDAWWSDLDTPRWRAFRERVLRHFEIHPAPICTEALAAAIDMPHYPVQMAVCELFVEQKLSNPGKCVDGKPAYQLRAERLSVAPILITEFPCNADAEECSFWASLPRSATKEQHHERIS